MAAQMNNLLLERDRISKGAYQGEILFQVSIEGRNMEKRV